MMDRNEAAKFLNLSASASSTELENTIEARIVEIENRIATAPTPALRAKLRLRRTDIENAAHSLRSFATTDIPSASITTNNFSASTSKNTKVEKIEALGETDSYLIRFLKWSHLFGRF